jgi:hypothetical protein
MLKFVLVLLAVLLAGCGTSAAASVGPAVAAQPPTENAYPSPTREPCGLAVERAGTFARRLAERLAALRPLLLAPRFDAARTLGVVRQVSSFMQFDADLPAVLASCETTEAIAAHVADLEKRAAKPIAASLHALFAPKGQRQAARALFKLLPAVLSISDEVQAVAGGLAINITPPTIPDGATDPLGQLPRL